MRRALLALLVPWGCGEPIVIEAAPDVGAERELASPAPIPEPAPPVVETPPPPPEPSAEEIARARAEAERAAFEEHYPLHGVTFHFLARVRARPRHDAEVVGYMRRGAQFRATQRVPGVRCARGWHEIPGGGFVCRGEGFLIGDEPQTFDPSPRPPSLESALPYTYAYSPRDHVSQFWRMPTTEEERSVRSTLEAIDAAREARAAAAEEAARRAEQAATAAPTPEAEPAEQETVVEAGAVEAPPPPGSDDAQPEDEANDPAAAVSAELGEQPELIVAQPPQAPVVDLTTPDFVRLAMRRGFYISLDQEERDGSRRFYRTIRGAYVRADHVTPNDPPTHRGVVLGGSWQLPVAFVFRGHTRKLRQQGTAFRESGQLARHTPMRVDTIRRRGRHDYVVTRLGDFVRRSSLRLAEGIERPAEIGEEDRWIHVNLSEQVMVAYEGDQPVFATTVSTGREGFETPTGTFRIQSKHVSTTMDDLHSEDEAYLIEDVPWTMYFEGNFALHAAFWHHSFGRVRSHGCVNLAPADARWVFQWTGPMLPASWHGVFADAERPGTWIHITQ